MATEAKLLIKQWKGLAAAAGVPQTKAPAPAPKTHSFAVDDLGDPTRQAARKKLQATLGEDASDADSYPAAEAVELALHRKWPNLQQPDQKRDYVAKLRQLSFNLKKNSELRSDVNSSAEIKILPRVRAESSRRPPRHRRDACSIAWRCRLLAARPSQHGRVIAEHPTHWLISTQALTCPRPSRARCGARPPARSC